MKVFNFFFILITIFFIAACDHDKNSHMIGKWQVSDIETKTDLVDSIKQAMLLNSTMQFTSDGHYTASGGIGADQGNYILNEKGETLSTISSAGRNNDVYTIEDLDKDKLVLTHGGTTITLTSLKAK